MPSRKCVLLVDDSEAELELMGYYLEEWSAAVRFDRALHGGEAIDYVLRRGRFASRTAKDPALVIIDNKMPVVGGIEAVRSMRGAPGWRFLPIVMWSGSVDPADLQRAYEAGVSSYLQKPSGAAQTQAMLLATMHYWLDLHCSPR